MNMNKKLIELRRNLTAKLKEARELIDAGKVEEGQKATQEAQEIKDQIGCFKFKKIARSV